MDERTKELSSQLNSPEEEKTDDKTENKKEDMEELKDEDEEETGKDDKNSDEEEAEDVVDEVEEKENQPEKKETADNSAGETEPDEKSEDKEETEKTSQKDKQDRWHGKSREEVIRSYEDLEKQYGDLKNDNPDETKEQEKTPPAQKPAVELDIPTDEELSKMTPKGFAEWMIKTVGKMVDKTYDTRSQIKEAVTSEIREAQKDHPLLKTNQEYRELILTMIDAAAQKGTVMPLKEACVKVDAIVGKVKGSNNKITDEDKARLKKAKAQVERGAGAPASPGEEKGTEQKRLESIFGTGRSKSPFGGLGV